MKRQARKTTPKVKDGRPQKKNRWAESPSYFNTPQPLPVIDRQRPGSRYRHLLRKKDIVTFVSILPDWDDLSRGLGAIVLAAGEWGTDGWYFGRGFNGPGVVGLCAWQRELWTTLERDHVEAHWDLIQRLGVEHSALKTKRGVTLKWTEDQARAFQLLHVFLHELGHHRDRYTTRGEGFAEAYANRYSAQIWMRYQETFGVFT